jgi:hypothetical protein
MVQESMKSWVKHSPIMLILGVKRRIFGFLSSRF